MTIKQSQHSQDATMQRQFEELSAAYSTQIAMTGDAQDELSCARRDAARLIDLLAEVNARLAEATATATDRTREVTAAVSELETLRAANADLRGHVQRLTKRCGELTSDLQDRESLLGTALADAEKARTDAELRVAAIQREKLLIIDRARGDAADRDERIMELSESLAAMRTESARSEQLAHELDVAAIQIQELTEARDTLAANTEALGRSRDAAMRRIAEQATLFQTRMRDAQAATREAQKTAEAELEALGQVLSQIETERLEALAELTSTREETARLRSALEAEAAALAAAQVQTARAEQQYADVRQRFALFVQRATASLRADVEQLAQSIDEIQGGRIWRAKRAIRRLKK